MTYFSWPYGPLPMGPQAHIHALLCHLCFHMVCCTICISWCHNYYNRTNIIITKPLYTIWLINLTYMNFTYYLNFPQPVDLSATILHLLGFWDSHCAHRQLYVKRNKWHTHVIKVFKIGNMLWEKMIHTDSCCYWCGLAFLPYKTNIIC